MPFPALTLVATLWVAATTPQARTGSRELTSTIASTYDEATCASVRNGDDDWTASAIGEDAPLDPSECPQSVAAQRVQLASLDCTTPLPSTFMNTFIGTCAVPKFAPQAAMHAEKHRRARYRADAAEAQSPLAPPPPRHDAAPFDLHDAPLLPPPLHTRLESSWPAPQLRSIATDTLLRPPRG